MSPNPRPSPAAPRPPQPRPGPDASWTVYDPATGQIRAVRPGEHFLTTAPPAARPASPPAKAKGRRT